MRKENISDRLMGCAIDLAVASVPGLVMADAQAMKAYKQLAGEVLVNHSVRRIKKLLPQKSVRMTADRLRHSLRKVS